MSWAEVKNMKDHLSALANSTLSIQCGENYAGKTIYLKRYDKEYMEVTLDSQAAAEISVAPRSVYEFVAYSEAGDVYTSGKFEVNTGEYISKELLMTYDGGTVTPLDDPVIWQKCAGIYETFQYTTFNAIYADVACITALLSNENACKYMIRSTGALQEAVLTSDRIAYLKANHVAQMAIAKSPDWCNKINSLNYDMLIWEYELPRGVSPTPVQLTPGTKTYFDDKSYMIGNAQITYVDTWFNGNLNGDNSMLTGINSSTFGYVQGTNVSNFSIEFYLEKPCILKTAAIYAGPVIGSDYKVTASTVQLQGYNEKESLWEDISSISKLTCSNGVKHICDLVNNTKVYNHYRFVATPNQMYGANRIFNVAEIHLKGVYADEEVTV